MSKVEYIKKEKKDIDGILLNTILKKDVYERIKEFAQSYSTGRGDWDFGVAIEILLNWFEESKLSKLTEKIDLIANMVAESIDKEPEKEKEEDELLGSEKKKYKR